MKGKAEGWGRSSKPNLIKQGKDSWFISSSGSFFFFFNQGELQPHEYVNWEAWPNGRTTRRARCGVVIVFTLNSILMLLVHGCKIHIKGLLKKILNEMNDIFSVFFFFPKSVDLCTLRSSLLITPSSVMSYMLTYLRFHFAPSYFYTVLWRR